MSVSDESAKKELDLWIAVIDARADQDPEFLSRIYDPRDQDEGPSQAQPDGPPDGSMEPRREIEMIMALNSSNLSPLHRGHFYQLKNGLTTWEDFGRHGNQETVEWFCSYDGKTPFFETPYWKSSIEFSTAAEAWMGRTRLRELAAQNSSDEIVGNLARGLGLEGAWSALKKQSDEMLMGRMQDIAGLLSTQPDPQAVKNIAAEILVIDSVLMSRGGSYEVRYRESSINNLTTHFRFSRIEDRSKQRRPAYGGPGLGVPGRAGGLAETSGAPRTAVSGWTGPLHLEGRSIIQRQNGHARSLSFFASSEPFRAERGLVDSALPRHRTVVACPDPGQPQRGSDHASVRCRGLGKLVPRPKNQGQCPQPFNDEIKSNLFSYSYNSYVG